MTHAKKRGKKAKRETNMDMEIFRNKLDRGEITDFGPFLYGEYDRYRWELAERGLCVNELIALNDDGLIIILIENGHATEHYEEWKNHPNNNVRETLASEGYFPEHFLRDKNRFVRASVYVKHPELACQGLAGTKAEQDAAIEALRQMPNITLPMLEKLLKHVHGRYKGDSYDIKQKSLEAKPSLLFATMTPKMLHQLGNPLWARGFSIKQISIIEDIRVQYLRDDEIDLFYELFEQIAQAKDRVEAVGIVRPLLKAYYEQNGNPHGVPLQRMFYR